MGRKKGIDKPCSSNAVDFGSPTESNLSELAGFSSEDREKLAAILESMKSLEIQVQRLNKKLETYTKEIGKLTDENVELTLFLPGRGGKFASPLSYFDIAPKLKKVLLSCNLTLNQI